MSTENRQYTEKLILPRQQNPQTVDHIIYKTPTSREGIPHFRKIIPKRTQEEYLQSVSLSPRQKDIINGLMNGLTRRTIGKSLNIQETSVKHHLQNLSKKLDTTSSEQAVSIALNYNMLQPDEITARFDLTNAGKITPAEIKVIYELTTLKGETTNDAIGERLWLSPCTVKRHMADILEKTNLATRDQVAAYSFFAKEKGLLRPNH